MKAILEFDLPDEKEEWELHFKASDMHQALWDIDQYLRSETKHAEVPADAYAIRERFLEILAEYGVEL